MKTVILSGFEPFGEDTINPALKILEAMEEESFDNFLLNTVQLPVVFGKATTILTEEIKNSRPDLVVSLGQAGGRMNVCVEKLGININNARIPDNEGNKPVDKLIIENGPAAYFTTIDSTATLDALKQNAIPAMLSYSAGLYVCNDLVYGVLHFLSTQKNPTKFGFIHVPYIPEQVVTKKKPFPSIPLEMLVTAVKIIIEANL